MTEINHIFAHSTADVTCKAKLTNHVRVYVDLCCENIAE
jgi:hypothetical protein